MYIYNPYGQSPEDFDKETAGSRIGSRMRAVREEAGKTQSELGEAVGLNANRIQQYENGARKPKFELCKQIAEALEVETSALLDPQIASYIGAMYAFFEMETLYDLRLKEVDGQMCICFGESQNDIHVSTMNKNLKTWFERRKKMEEAMLCTTSEEEKKQIIHDYHMWEWNFPHSTSKNVLPKSERAKMEREAHMLEKTMNSEKNSKEKDS